MCTCPRLAHHAHGREGDAELGADRDLGHGGVTQPEQVSLGEGSDRLEMIQESGRLTTATLIGFTHHFQLGVGERYGLVEQLDRPLQVAPLHLCHERLQR